MRPNSAKVLLGPGDTVVRAIFGEDAAVRALRGRWQIFRDPPPLPTCHPLARRRPHLEPVLVQDVAMAWARLRQGGRKALSGRRKPWGRPNGAVGVAG